MCVCVQRYMYVGTCLRFPGRALWCMSRGAMISGEEREKVVESVCVSVERVSEIGDGGIVGEEVGFSFLIMNENLYWIILNNILS